MDENRKALDKIIEDTLDKEHELEIRSEKLAEQNQAFADYLRAKKHADDEIKVLWDMAKEFMEENHITKHENEYITLSLSPSGKFKLEDNTDINDIPDDFCDVKKVLNNKKIKAYLELNDELPEGIKSTGNILRKTLKSKD